MNATEIRLWLDVVGAAIIRAEDKEEAEFFRLWRAVLFEELKGVPVVVGESWRI